MKLASECVYITPCGFCKRKNKQCEEYKNEIDRKNQLKEEKEKPIEKAPWE